LKAVSTSEENKYLCIYDIYLFDECLYSLHFGCYRSF
jgi:hypothetical protein